MRFTFMQNSSNGRLDLKAKKQKTDADFKPERLLKQMTVIISRLKATVREYLCKVKHWQTPFKDIKKFIEGIYIKKKIATKQMRN